MDRKKLDSNIKKIAEKYADVVRSKFPVEKVVIFGSQVKGTAKNYSDIDIAVVSKVFGYDRQAERLILSRLVDSIDLRIEPHPFNPDELTNPWDSLTLDIKRYGIAI